MGITSERIQKLRAQCAALLATGVHLQRKELRQLAGLVSWMVGLMPQLKPFATMVWAALQCTRSSTIRLQHVRGAVQWLDAFAREDFGPVERRCRGGTRHYMVITFDGSLTGGGATLRAGVMNVRDAHQHPVVTFWYGSWSDEELRALQVHRGEP